MFAVKRCALSVLVFAALVAAACAASAADDLDPVMFGPTPKHAPVALVRAGKPLGHIVATGVPAAVTRDLQKYVEKSTGALLPIVGKKGDGPAIVIDPAADVPGGPEAFAIRTTADSVTISGPGAAHGVYEFLERFVGVRFYWPEYDNEFGDAGTSIVPSDSLVVPPVNLTDAPAFAKRIRWPSGGPRIGKARMTDHDRRLRCADTWPVKLIVHAPHEWNKLYAETRPEIFQLRKDGGRDFGMLCYGNPRTLDTYLEQIASQIEKPVGRDISVIDGKSITVSPGDMAVSCRCDDCRALWNDEGGTYGTASRVLATFVAKLAAEVKTRWPDMTVVFLPYKNYTAAPEGVAFPDNVEVQICGMPGLALYKDATINASEQANINAWAALSGRRIQNWHYSCWPANRTDAAYLFPHTVQKHYRANREKTVGTFINGVEDHWPRQHISLYVWLKVLWDPEIDVDAVIDEYCRRMYGPAAGTMRELVGMLIDGWEGTEWSRPVLSPTTVYEESYPREDVVKMEALLAQAYAQAEGDELVTRRLGYYAPSLRAFFAESKLLAEGAGIKPLNVYQAAEQPTLDGKLDEECWQTIEPVSFVVGNETKAEPKFPTELKAVWTREGVTFGFRMTEPDVDTLMRDIGKESRDASLIWWNDNVEIFLDPTGRREGYAHFIVNANGALYDGIGRENSAWNAPDMKAAGFVGDGFWSLEVYIPYRDFEDVVLPETGAVWFGNFTRHRVTDRTAREYQGFNVTTGAPSHNQNAFGPIKFIER